MGSELVKKCVTCKELKSLCEFHKDKTKKDGHGLYCKTCAKKRTAKWQAENPKKAREKDRRWQVANPKKCKEIHRQWRMANSEKVKENKRRASKKRRSTPKGKLHHAISKSMNHSLKGNKNGRHWETLVGYTIDDLKKHLEKQFKNGMTWEKLLSGEIHIDHRIPISVFNFETPEDSDFKQCWALKNLQPMWAKENISKSTKLSKPFQPSFAFAPTQTI